MSNQGEWVIYNFDISSHPLHCKNCGRSIPYIENEYIKEFFNYCPYCGARMKQT